MIIGCYLSNTIVHRMGVSQWLSLLILFTPLWEKQLSIEFNVAQPDGIPPVAINARFALRTKETGHGVVRDKDC
jgi:hypothetical protein